ncbi:MAG: DUF5674 family protein [Patescibacteria group bacterium]
MNIKVIKDTIGLPEVQEIAQEFYFPMIKGVVDIEKGIIALGGEYHNDANMLLQKEEGCKQSDIWGFNIYTDKPKEEWLEYTSLINIRPAVGNRSMIVGDQIIRDKMKAIINSKII